MNLARPTTSIVSRPLSKASAARPPRGLLLVRAEPKEYQSDKPEASRGQQASEGERRAAEELAESDARERKRILEPENVPAEQVEPFPAGGRPYPHGTQLAAYADEQDTKIDKENPDLDIPREEDIGSRI